MEAGGRSQKVKAGTYKWVMLLLIALPGFVINHSQFLLSAWSNDFMTDFGLDTVRFSAVTLSFTIVAAVMAVIGGSLADRFGPKRIIVIFGAISTVGALGRTLTHNYTLFFILSVLTGAVFGASYGSAGKIIDEWFPKRQYGLAFSLYCCGGALGVSSAQLFAAAYGSYNTALFVSGLFFLILTLVWLLFGRNAPKGKSLPPSDSVVKSLGKVLRIKNVWAMGIGTACFSTFILAGSSLLPQMLMATRGIDQNEANTITSLLNLFALIGSVIIPLIQVKIGLIKPVLILQLTLSGLFIALVIIVPTTVIPAMISLSGFFISCGEAFMVTTLTNLKEIKKNELGSAVGFTTFIKFFLGGFIIPTFIVSPIMEIKSAYLVICIAVSCIVMIVAAAILPEVGEKKHYRDNTI